jgi:excinuclease ABC subunit A
VPQVRQKLQTLVDVGLGYVHLGQSATTLSGGEAQRMKLARELSKRQTGRTLYLLDEPTTGLHFDDVRKLLEVLHRLTDLGNTVIIIEHNLDMIRNADWIVDLGPEGGEDGGRIVGQGRPAKIAATPGSYTGQFLKRYYTSSSGRLAPAGIDDDSTEVDSTVTPATLPIAQVVADEPAKRTTAKKTPPKNPQPAERRRCCHERPRFHAARAGAEYFCRARKYGCPRSRFWDLGFRHSHRMSSGAVSVLVPA